MKRRVKKQSGNRAARLAARILRELDGCGPDDMIGTYTARGRMIAVYAREVRTLAASVLSQDETKGPRITIDTRGVSKNDYLFKNKRARKK